jgi:hypothetical protein
MTQYRLYRRHAAGQTPVAPAVITANDDDEAQHLARQRKLTPCEIWDEARLVAVIGSH